MEPTWVLSTPDGPHEPCYQGEYPAIKANSDEWAEVEVEFWAKHTTKSISFYSAAQP